jgi:hypothetical protein
MKKAAKEARQKLEKAILDDLTSNRTKVKRKRKPMTEEQRKAASERLAKARQKRQAANPPQYKNVHPSVVALPDDDTFSRKNVTEWIKYQKQLLSEHRKAERQGLKHAAMHAADTAAYIRHCEWYLKNGDWIDDRYGKEGTNVVKRRVVVPRGNKYG